MSDVMPDTRTQLYWNAMLRVPSQLMTFIISIYVTRLLEPKDYGVMAVVMMLIGYSNLLMNFGFTQAVIQKRITDKPTLNSIFTFNLCFSCVLVGGFYSAAGFIAEMFKNTESENVIKLMSLVFLFSAFMVIPSAILKRDMDFKTISIVDFMQQLIMSCTTLILALKGFGYWALAYGQLLPLIAMTIVLYLKTAWVPRIQYHHAAMRPIFNFGAWNVFNTQLGAFVNQTDKFIVGRWLGLEDLGFYDKGRSIAEIPYDSLIMNINGVMFSSFSKKKDDLQSLGQQFKKSLALLSFLNCPIYMGLIIIAPYFVESLLGDKWSPMILPFQILLFGMLVKSFGGIASSLNIGIGKYRQHTLRLFSALLIFIATSLMLVRFGINGMAVSYVIFGLVSVWLWMKLSMSHLSMSWKDTFAAVAPGMWASLVMFLVAQIEIVFLFTDRTVLNMAYIVVSGAIIYCLCLLLDRSQITTDFKTMIWSDVRAKRLALSTLR